MNHNDHVRLLQNGITETGGTWADFGSGWGAFTLALAELLGPDVEIYSLDLDRRALDRQQREMHLRFPDTSVHYVVADFTQPHDLPPLNGIVMANSLHYQRNKDPVVQLARDNLKPGGRLILVEYNTDRGNHWVPFPLSYRSWEALATRNGFSGVRLLGSRPSRFLGEIYSAIAFKPT